jgi:hypothetical protein
LEKTQVQANTESLNPAAGFALVNSGSEASRSGFCSHLERVRKPPNVTTQIMERQCKRNNLSGRRTTSKSMTGRISELGSGSHKAHRKSWHNRKPSAVLNSTTYNSGNSVDNSGAPMRRGVSAPVKSALVAPRPQVQYDPLPFMTVVVVTLPEGTWRVTQAVPIGGTSLLNLYVPP